MKQCHFIKGLDQGRAEREVQKLRSQSEMAGLRSSPTSHATRKLSQPFFKVEHLYYLVLLLQKKVLWGGDSQGLLFQPLPYESFPPSNDCLRKLWTSVPNISIQLLIFRCWSGLPLEKRKTLALRVGKLLRMGMSKILLPAQNPREMPWPPGFDIF